MQLAEDHWPTPEVISTKYRKTINCTRRKSLNFFLKFTNNVRYSLLSPLFSYYICYYLSLNFHFLHLRYNFTFNWKKLYEKYSTDDYFDSTFFLNLNNTFLECTFLLVTIFQRSIPNYHFFQQEIAKKKDKS